MLTCSFLTIFFLTRIFSPSLYGNYAFITTTILFFFNLADFGIGTIAVKKSAKGKTTQNKIFNQALGAKLLFTVITVIIAVIAVITLPQFQGIRLPALIAVSALFFHTSRALANIFFIASSQFIKKVFFECWASILFLAAVTIIFFSFPDISISGVILFWVLASFLSGLGAITFLLKQEGFKLNSSFFKIKGLIKESLPLGTRQLIFATYDLAIDSFFIKTILGSIAVGHYNLAYKIYGNLILLAAFFMNSLFPVMIKKSPRDLKNTFSSAFKILLPTGLVIAAVTQFGAPFLINLIGGPLFAASINVLRILSLALVFAYLNHLIGYTMIALGFGKKLLYFSLAALAVNFLGNWFLIPHWQLTGAAVTTGLTELVMMILGGMFLLKRIFW